MKYVSYRIDTQAIKGQKVVDGFFIRGQRASDLNWTLLADAESMDAAMDYIRKVSKGQTVYGIHGYEIRI